MQLSALTKPGRGYSQFTRGIRVGLGVRWQLLSYHHSLQDMSHPDVLHPTITYPAQKNQVFSRPELTSQCMAEPLSWQGVSRLLYPHHVPELDPGQRRVQRNSPSVHGKTEQSMTGTCISATTPGDVHSIHSGKTRRPLFGYNPVTCAERDLVQQLARSSQLTTVEKGKPKIGGCAVENSAGRDVSCPVASIGTSV